MQSVDKFIDQIDALPSAPQILPKLLSVLAEPDTDVERVTDLIAYDPGLTAKVLQLCNSAWLASATPASDIGEAVSRLGMRCIYRLVAAVNGSRALRPTKPVAGLEPDVLWKHSVVTALAAQFMAQDQGQEESAVFTSALLHDAGKVVMAQAYKADYGQLLLQCQTEPATLSSREQEQFGMEHAAVGGRLLAKWQFPEAMVGGVTHHHQPGSANGWKRQSAYVCLADALAHFVDDPSRESCPAGSAAASALGILGLSQEDVLHYRDRTLENFEFVNALCRL